MPSTNNRAKISVIGTGYVGLVTATCIAEMGNEVICIDIDAEKISKLRRGIVPFFEPGLEELVTRNAKAGRLTFSTNARDLVRTDIIFIAVGTPPGKNGEPNLTGVRHVVNNVGRYIKRRTIIVTKSTVPVGMGKEIETTIAAILRRRHVSVNFAVVSNPEFLKEGAAISDFMKPDRIVLGVNKAWAAKIMKELYAPFMINGHPILVMDRESSEMSKYASNAMLACKISFMNQMVRLCETTGADITRVREAMSLDVRIGSQFLHAGVGYGGSCFPKDVQALNALAVKIGYAAPLLAAIEAVNQQQKNVLPQKAIKHFRRLKNRTFAIWGAAFKPNTDDVREAPSLTIIETILAEGGRVSVYDPKATSELRKIFGRRIKYATDMYSACRHADALMLVTEWPEFREPNFAELKKLMKSPVIFDGRNIYQPPVVKKLGFHYYGIGR